MSDLDDKDEFFSHPMTDEETKEYYRRRLEEHKGIGRDRLFKHCDKEWWVDRQIEPVVICPECGEAMAAMSIMCTTCSCYPCICGLTTW